MRRCTPVFIARPVQSGGAIVVLCLYGKDVSSPGTMPSWIRCRPGREIVLPVPEACKASSAALRIAGKTNRERNGNAGTRQETQRATAGFTSLVIEALRSPEYKQCYRPRWPVSV